MGFWVLGFIAIFFIFTVLLKEFGGATFTKRPDRIIGRTAMKTKTCFIAVSAF